MTIKSQNQMSFDFDKWRKELPESDFQRFKEMAEGLFSATDNSYKSLMDVGEWATKLRDLLGKEKFDRFCFDAGYDVKTLERLSTARAAFKLHSSYGLKRNVGRNMLMLLLAVAPTLRDKDLQDAVKDANELPYHEWKEKYKRKEDTWRQSTAFPMTEADVKRQLQFKLERAGHEIISAGEFRTWADRAPDLISKYNGDFYAWECKHNPTREGMYQGLGQTEVYAHTIGRGTRRGFAYSDPEEKHLSLHVLFELLGVHMELVVLIEVPKDESAAKADITAPEYH